MLFSDLIVWYLFFGGLGGGLCLSALFIDLRARSGLHPWIALNRTVRQPLLIASFIALAIGCACLMKDLALPERALLLFTKPTFSAITIGAYALASLLICLGILIVLGFRSKSSAHPAFRIILHLSAAALSCILIVYTGMLLSSMAAVPLWLSAFVPVLFALSSLSSGIAGTLLLAAFLQESLAETTRALQTMFKLDGAIIILETIAAVALAFHLLGNAQALPSVEALASGHLAAQFWFGFIGCGIIAPLIMETSLSSRFAKQPAFCIVLGCLILIGAFFLRYCTVFGGVHLSVFMFA